jgi:hypothetical protein
MSNKNWIKGGASPNPLGRPKKKKSAPSVARQLERFVQRNCSPRKLQALYDGLKANEKLTFLVDVLPYVASRKPQAHAIGVGQLNDQQLQQVYEQVLDAIDVFDVPEIEDADHEEIKLLAHGQTG